MIIQGDSLDRLKELENDSIDSIITDPPYGYSFMGKDWDKAVPSVDIWRECLRVLKPGGWCMVMSAPRSDVQNAMISRLMEAGFRLDFTPIYWTYASGFPKAGNVGKLVDKRNGRMVDPAVKNYLNERRTELSLSLARINQLLGTATNGGGVASAIMGDKTFNELPTLAIYEQLKIILHLDNRFDGLIEREEAEREIVGKGKYANRQPNGSQGDVLAFSEGKLYGENGDITAPATEQAKALDGSYTGFQPKPAVEVIIVAMKPLSEKTYVDQALKNGKGITWLDDCRIGTGDGTTKTVNYPDIRGDNYAQGKGSYSEKKTVEYQVESKGRFPANLLVEGNALADHSKYFDLDAWADTLPFLAVPKASKSEKNKGLEHLLDTQAGSFDGNIDLTKARKIGANPDRPNQPTKNHHPTVKPLKLMSYLITLTTREGDTVLDPFVGSGTTVVAAKQLGRNGIGIEREMEYAEIAAARVDNVSMPAILGQDEAKPEEIIEKSEPVPTKPVQARLF